MNASDDLIKQAYDISEEYDIILKGNIKICSNVNCILFTLEVFSDY